MIDDYAQAMALMRQMEAQLPIPARPTGSLARLIRERDIRVVSGQELQIRRLFYHGDEGGIVCDVTPSDDAEEVLVVSLTHLRVSSRHPLAQEIRAYQRERTRRIALSDRPTEPSSFTVRPRRKRRR